MKKIIFVLPVLIIGFIIITGQKNPDIENWNLFLPTNNIDPNEILTAPLPISSDYLNPNSEPRTITTSDEILVISPNVRVLPRNNSYQSELYITRHPLNPLIMFGSSNAFSNTGFLTQGVYVTTNGGLNWFGSDTMSLSNGTPVPNIGGDPGITIDKNGTFIQTHLGSISSGLYGNYSTDNGATWSSNFTIASGSQDKNLAATDDVPSSPYYGRSYVVWSIFNLSGPPVIGVSYTSNSGVSWTTPPIQVNSNVSDHYSQGSDIRVGTNGEVYAVWTAPSIFSSSIEDFLGFAKSTNGGDNWTVTDNAYDMNGIRGEFSSKSGIRVNGFPRIDVDKSGGPRNGWIYVVAAEKFLAPAGSDPDVIMHISSDGGNIWSNGIRVNQDPLNNGKYQWFPVVKVDDAGGVNVVYYDDRNTSSDSSEVYLSRSLDGGVTWTDVLISDHRFKPKPIAGLASGYQGDYIGLTSGNSKLWPLWMDDASGIYQAWTTGVHIEIYPLNSYNLNSPVAGSRIETLPNNNKNNSFTWDTSASTASYKWIFGSPIISPRKITIVSPVNSLNITSGELDNILEGLGLEQGDSLVGQWDVWAFRNNTQNDSLNAFNGPRSITLKRAKPLLTSFNLSSPPDNTTIITRIANTDSLNISWTMSGEAVRYKWLYASPDFSSNTNVKLSVPSFNNGYDSIITLKNSQLDSMLSGIGVAVGDSSVGQWRVYGYSAADSLSSTQTFNIKFKRGIPPTVSTTLDSIIVNVQSGQSATRNMMIGNSGHFDLNWTISENSLSLSENQNSNTRTDFKSEHIEIIDENPKKSGHIFLDNQGGPDGGGYRWIDSDEPGGPVFDWVEISTTGIPITTWTSGSADNGSVILQLPFTFRYYDIDYTSLKIVTNGWMGFDVSIVNNSNFVVGIPAGSQPNNALYPFWNDLDPGMGGNVYYLNDPVNNRFIIEYKDVPHHLNGLLYTFQVILYGDGRIFYQYLNMDQSTITSYTIGTENAWGWAGLQVAHNTAYLHSNLAIKIEKDVQWLAENPSLGTVIPGGSQSVDILFNSTGLSNGVYAGVINVNSNDPINPVKTIPVKFTVGVIGIENSNLGVPIEFAIEQNYPNPFNPITNISFAIPQESFVSIKIYDILGKEVSRLVNENKQAGYYDYNFDASALSSGMYFYKIEAGNFVKTKRMLLMK